MKWGKQQLPFRCVGSRIRKLRARVQNKQGVTPATMGEAVRGRSPLLAGRRVALPEPHAAISDSILPKQSGK